MDRVKELERDLQTERERLARLSEATIRLNESLELETVLQRILDGARSLTRARYGLITLQDNEGRMEARLTSGLTPEETGQLWSFSEGERLFQYLANIRDPLRVRDFSSHIRSLGLPEFSPPATVSRPLPFLATSIRQRADGVVGLFLAYKEGGRDFTAEDEEILVTFASQAAQVVVNARRYRKAQRARRDLEAQIKTSPMGVVVFDARTAEIKSFNRETTRILEGLRIHDRPTRELLEVATIRRADGRESSLVELASAEALNKGETIRAEEVAFEVPGGGRASALMNATPVHSEEGRMESFVVTLQDMTPLEDLGRLRGEFLSMLSHELRTPLAAIKGSAATVLDDASEWDGAEMVQFFRIINEQADHMGGLIDDLLDVARIEAGVLRVNPEPVTVIGLLEKARNAFSGGSGKCNVRIELAPDLPAVMADRRPIVQVLGNLLSYASRNASETSVIRIIAAQEGVHVAIHVVDEGCGASPEGLPRMFQRFPRLKGRNFGGGHAGSGWGLPICRGIVEAHGGRIWAEGEGSGTRVAFTLPIAEESGSDNRPGSAKTATPGTRRRRERTPILVVDDDAQTLRKVGATLSNAGYFPVMTGDPDEVPRLMNEHRPHLVVLDLVLPSTDGVEVMTNVIRNTDVPVIFLSAYGHEEAIARAIDAGADDYVVKPFSPTELAARIRAALRKRKERGRSVPEDPYVLGDLSINYARRQVTVAGRPILLTNIEYRLLAELSLNAGMIVTYDELLQRVWGRRHAGDTRTLRTAVKRVRRKLGDEANQPVYVFNAPRIGYHMGMAE